MEHQEPLPPVEGEVIPLSFKKAFSLIAICVALVPLCVVVDWCWWNDVTIPYIKRHITWWGALLALVMIVFGIMLPPILLWKLFVSKECLILGERCLQIISNKKEQKVVDLQIPYDGIQSHEIVTQSERKLIGIRMKDIHDPNFYSPNIATIEKITDPNEHHVFIEDEYRMSLKEICQKIEAAKANRKNS